MVTGQVVQATRQREGSTGAGKSVRFLPTKAWASFRPHWSFSAAAGGLAGRATAGGAVGVVGGGMGAGSGAPLEQEASNSTAPTHTNRFMPASPIRVRRPGASRTRDGP